MKKKNIPKNVNGMKSSSDIAVIFKCKDLYNSTSYSVPERDTLKKHC